MNSWPYYSAGGGSSDGGGSSSGGGGRDGEGEGGGSGGNYQNPPPKKEIQLQGPRPSSLEVSKGSHTIRKPPRAPPRPSIPYYHQQQGQQQQQQFRNTAAGVGGVQGDANLQPVIIYDVSPKVIHATADEFRNLVQRLTGIASEPAEEEGPSSVWGSSSSDPPISPAERLAALDRVSPTGGRVRERGEIILPGPEFGGGGRDPMDIMASLDFADAAGMLDLGLFPGILSPAPANLPPTPPVDSWAPIGYQNNNNPLSPLMNALLPSPSWNHSLFPSPSSIYFPSPGSNNFFPSAPITSPVLSPVMDFSNIFDS